MPQCPEQPLQLQDEGAFLTNGHVNITAHRIGLVLCGVSTLATWIISIASIILHLVNYWQPDEQRQIVRILILPMIYSLCSLLAYFLFAQFEYFELIQALAEGLALSSFLMLLFAYVSKADGGHRHEVIASKSKYKLPFPLCCISYWPYKPAFLNVLKWLVLQYAIIQVLGTIAGAVTEAYDLYCEGSNSPAFANIYIQGVDFLAMSLALYALLTWYDLCKEILRGGRRRPAIKFLTIKLTVGILFTQAFVIKLLAGNGTLPSSPYWSSTAVAHSLTAFLTCFEMVIFSLWYQYAFSWKDYRESKPYPTARTPFWRSLGHAANISDLLLEIWHALSFFCAYCRNKQGTRSKHFKGGLDAGAAFNDEASYEKEGSWQMIEKPSMAKAPHSKVDVETPTEEAEGPDYASYRHTLGPNSPHVNAIVETLSDEHFTPGEQRRIASQSLRTQSRPEV